MALIAIVDDSMTIRRFVAVILAERYETIDYATGTEALAGLAGVAADLVLLDIELPDLNGPEVLRRLRDDEQLRDLPVIALTAHAEVADLERFAALGFDAHVTKPIVDTEALFAEIDRLLAS
jgi:CheY-like chemotaxis protein